LNIIIYLITLSLTLSMVDNNLFPTHTGHYLHFIVLSWDLELLKERQESLSYLLRLIFLNAMAHLIQHNQFELALHLGNGQILVHPVTACQQELFGYSNI
jgi:hypothetical protein